jgi:3-hydroxymyristoyl/3-hydroxydecanoyl-(acyl carrier protein) dehydratase
MQDSIRRAQNIVPQVNSDGSAHFEFCFPTDDRTFAGHFPNRPLLPGVIQLEIVRFAAEAVLKQPLFVREIVKAKFLRPIIPTEIVCVELKLTENPATIQARASFSVTGQPAGEAILHLARS